MIRYAELTDSLLLSMLKDDDEAAYTEIYHRYKKKLFFHAYKKLNDQSQAEDVVQDLFIKLWQKRAIIATNSLPSYLYTAIRNGVLDIISHQSVQSAYIISLQEFLNRGEAVTDHRVRMNMLKELIDKEIAKLPDKMREVFEMSRKMHLSHRQISDELGISEKTVKNQVNNALKILRGRFTLWVLLLILFSCNLFFIFLLGPELR